MTLQTFKIAFNFLWLESSVRIGKRTNYLIHIKIWIGFRELWRQLYSVKSTQYYQFFVLSWPPIFRNYCLLSMHSAVSSHLRGGGKKKKKGRNKKDNKPRTYVFKQTFYWCCSSFLFFLVLFGPGTILIAAFSLPPPTFFASFLKHRQSISVSYYSTVYFPRDTIQLFISSLSSQNEQAQGMHIYKMYHRGSYYQWVAGTWGQTVPKHQERCWWANMGNVELPMPWLLAMDLVKKGWPWPQGHQDHLQGVGGDPPPRTVLQF